MSNINSDYYFLSGGGEMGALIRATDWSKTPLGDPVDWPQSLRTMIAVMLNYPFGMYIAWGSDYIQLYNDGYRPILGTTKHPQALGISTQETFSEIWHIIKPMFNDVMDGKAVGFPDLMLPLNRNGFVEECYFDFAYSPIRKDNGEVGGVLVTVSETTNKRNTEEALKESEARFRAIADDAPVFIFLAGENAEVEYLNKTWREYTGLSTNDYKGRAWAEITHIDDIDSATKIYMDGFNKRESCSFENRQKGIDGIYRTILWKATPRFSLNGKFIGMMGVGVDIHERKKSEEKLRESELRFRLALAGSNQIVFSQDKNLIHTWIYNPHPDFKQDDIIGKSDKDLHVPETAAVLTRIKQTVLDTGKAFYGDIEIEISGKKTNYTLYIEAIKDSDETITGITGTSIDITERIKIERQIKESEEQFSTLADNMENLAWLADSEGYRFWYNKRWLEYTGLNMDELEGWGWQKVHHPHYMELLANNKKIWHINETFELTFPLRRHDGEYRWFLTRGHPVTNEEGKIIRWIGTNTDINEQIKAEEQFRQMAERMPQKVWTADAQGNRNYFNQIMLNYTGLTFEELKDWGWKKIIHPEDWPHTKKKWEYAINTGEDFENETRLLRKDGKYLWHLVRATAIKDEKGNPKIWIGSKTEIQEQIELSETLGENLKRSNERMQTILQHAPDAIISIDEDGIIKSWNSEAETIFGWKEHEVIEKTLTETIIPKRYRDGHDTGMKHFLRTGEGPVINKPIELSALKKNGNEFPVELKISTSKINDSYIFIGFIRDISIRKAAEETIQNKTNQLIEAQELAHIGSWEWDVRSNRINWSDELYRIFGLTAQEFEADYDSYLKYIHPDDKEYVNSIVQKAFNDHLPYKFFHKTLSPKGNIRILSATGKVFTDEAGNVIKMSGTAQDVTEQKKYEEELKESEERYHLMISEVQDYAIILLSKEGIVENWNKGAENIKGYKAEEIIGKSFSAFYTVEDRANNIPEKLLALASEKGKATDENWRVRKDGTRFWGSIVITALHNNKNSVIGFVKVTRDLTRRKDAEDNLKQNAELLKQNNIELEKMNKELESFAYVSSHDLQEPLRKIQTFASRIAEKEENNLSDNAKDMFNRMQDAAKRMQTLIQDLLAYSRTNTIERNFETTDLNEIIAEVKKDLKEELQEKHAIIEVNQLCEAKIILFQFRQLLHNLIGNSLKFSNPANPPHIQIKSEIANGVAFKNEKLSPQQKYCHISFSDNGIGFEEKYNEKIFEVFQRLHGKNEYKGTGIGLSIVKKIVDNHNGIITAKGELNKGATFDIYIPAT